MTIGYKQIFQWGDPTYFKEKVLASQKQPPLTNITLEWETDDTIDYIDIVPKIHTMREDPNDRWPPSTGIIHHCYGNRTKERDNFLITPCVSIQRIHILSTNLVGQNKKGQDLVVGTTKIILIDGRTMDQESIKKLALNDGFPSVEKFFQWFNHDFYGKIIHWTKWRY